MSERKRKPPWLRVRLGGGRNTSRLRRIIESRNLHTVCSEALCPNMGECWENGRATLMILGDCCSRNCTFCNVSAGIPSPPDHTEPERVAEAVKEMGLNEVVITSVTRDDLPDGGAEIWARTISSVREAAPRTVIEVLIPDFKGSAKDLNTVLRSGPDILAHNLETVESLYPEVRPGACYEQSLEVLKRAAESGFITKSGIMAGLGETKSDTVELMNDLIGAGCDIFTIGQYLQPTKEHHPVMDYVPPEDFDYYRQKGLQMGFHVVVSGPLVRSSYHSEEQSRWVCRKCSEHGEHHAGGGTREGKHFAGI